MGSSSQHGDVGRNTLLPHTTKRRITTNVKTINNQNCQTIKLHGTLTTKEIKKHSSRQVGGVETGRQAERTRSKAADCAGKAELADHRTKDSRPPAVKFCGGCKGGRNSLSHRTVHWKVGLEQSKWAALFPLWPLPHRQHHKRVALDWQIPKAPSLTM